MTEHCLMLKRQRRTSSANQEVKKPIWKGAFCMIPTVWHMAKAKRGQCQDQGMGKEGMNRWSLLFFFFETCSHYVTQAPGFKWSPCQLEWLRPHTCTTTPGVTRLLGMQNYGVWHCNGRHTTLYICSNPENARCQERTLCGLWTLVDDDVWQWVH